MTNRQIPVQPLVIDDKDLELDTSRRAANGPQNKHGEDAADASTDPNVASLVVSKGPTATTRPRSQDRV